MKRDPLREWLQQGWTSLCACSHCLNAATTRTPTPIEQMMSNALVFARDHCYSAPDWEWHEQWPTLDYVADFIIRSPRFQIVIECDGHNFHERTKEQAAHDRSRDRKMTEAGIIVMRYTGSEIWRNPFACAFQAVNLGLSIDISAHERERKAQQGAA